MQNIRVFFKKEGKAAYISHLDLMRTMTRALKKAEIPVWYTQGFNPHIYLTFALPLSLGMESVCESFDTRLMEPMPFDEVKQRLNSVMPHGLSVYDVAEHVSKPTEITYARYEVELYSPVVDSGTVNTSLTAFFDRPEIPVEKKSKSKMQTIDVKPHIEIIKCEQSEDSVLLEMLTSAGGTFNLNPSVVFKAFEKELGAELVALIKRTAVLDSRRNDFK